MDFNHFAYGPTLRLLRRSFTTTTRYRRVMRSLQCINNVTTLQQINQRRKIMFFSFAKYRWTMESSIFSTEENPKEIIQIYFKSEMVIQSILTWSITTKNQCGFGYIFQVLPSCKENGNSPSFACTLRHEARFHMSLSFSHNKNKNNEYILLCSK